MSRSYSLRSHPKPNRRYTEGRTTSEAEDEQRDTEMDDQGAVENDQHTDQHSDTSTGRTTPDDSMTDNPDLRETAAASSSSGDSPHPDETSPDTDHGHTTSPTDNKTDTNQLTPGDIQTLINLIQTQTQTLKQDLKAQNQTLKKDLLDKIEQNQIQSQASEQNLLTKIDKIDKNTKDMTLEINNLKGDLSSMIDEKCSNILMTTQKTIQQSVTTLKEEIQTLSLDTEVKIDNLRHETESLIALKTDTLCTKKEANDYTDLKVQQSERVLSLKIQQTKEAIENDSLRLHEVIKDNNNLFQQRFQIQDLEIDSCKEGIDKIAKEVQSITEKPNKQPIGHYEPVIQIITPPNLNNLPKFDSRNINPRDFLNRIGNYYSDLQNKTTTKDSISYLTLVENCLQGPAADWYCVVKENIKNQDDFEQLFLDHYWNQHIQQLVKKGIESETYRPEGRLTMTAYCLKKLSKLTNLTPKLQESELVQILGNHFNPIISDAITVQNINSVNKLLELLNRSDLQEAGRQIKARNNNSNTTEHLTEKTQNYSERNYDTRQSNGTKYEQRNSNYHQSKQYCNRRYGDENGASRRHTDTRWREAEPGRRPAADIKTQTYHNPAHAQGRQQTSGASERENDQPRRTYRLADGKYQSRGNYNNTPRWNTHYQPNVNCMNYQYESNYNQPPQRYPTSEQKDVCETIIRKEHRPSEDNEQQQSNRNDSFAVNQLPLN